MDIVIGIGLLLFGLVITFMGLQVFFATLPLLGFIFGFFAGAAGVEAIFGDGFLSTVSGWVVGFFVGLLFAFISWFWWYAGVVVAAGTLGAILGTGLANLFGIDSEVVIFFFALIGFAAFLFFAFVSGLPIFLVIVNTALAGATIVITGLLLVINRVDRGELGYGTAIAIIEESWWWVLVSAVLAIAGIIVQLTQRASVQLPEDRWGHATPSSI